MRLQPQYRYAPEFRGVLDDAAIQSATTATGVGMAGGAILQGVVSGAIVGGLSAGSIRGAGTGALLAGGLGGALAGGALLVAGSANSNLRVGGGIGLALGLVMLGFGGTRSYRAIKGR
jgi:hypothetical protein